jgi:hypothetical protein
MNAEFDINPLDQDDYVIHVLSLFCICFIYQYWENIYLKYHIY